MGPFQVSDLAGLDIGYRNWRRKAQADREPVDGWVPERLVEAGDLCRKSGRGFYDYGAPTRFRARSRRLSLRTAPPS